jgi:hypothetical protein
MNKLPTHKVINNAGSGIFRGSLTTCVKYLQKTKNTIGYKIIKLS